MGSEAVKVVVRCRPLNDREKALSSKMVLSMDLQHCQCFIEKPGAADEPPKQFTFDGTYFIDQTTEQMYNEIAYPLVEVGYSKTLVILCLGWRSVHYRSSTLVTGHPQANSRLYLIANDCRPHYLLNSLLSVTHRGQQDVHHLKKLECKNVINATFFCVSHRVSLRDTTARFLHTDKLEVGSLSPCRECPSLQPRGESSREPLSTSLRAFRYVQHLLLIVQHVQHVPQPHVCITQ